MLVPDVERDVADHPDKSVNEPGPYLPHPSEPLTPEATIWQRRN